MQMGAGETAQLVQELAAKPGGLISAPRTILWKKRRGFRKLSFDLDTDEVAHTCFPHPHKNPERDRDTKRQTEIDREAETDERDRCGGIKGV